MSFEGSSHSKNARAWVDPKELYTINYNLSQIHDGNDFLGMSIDDTTKHEMGHLIDYFFKNREITDDSLFDRKFCCYIHRHNREDMFRVKFLKKLLRRGYLA